MDFELTEEQSILKDTLRRYLQDQHDFEARGHTLRDPVCARALWDGLAEMGLTGAPFAEEVGGFGGGPVEAMIVQEALGEALVCAPWSETVILCGRLLEAIATPASFQLLADLVSGQARPALAHWEPQARNCLHHVATTATAESQGWRLDGGKALAIGAQDASHLLVTARTSGAVRDAAGISLFCLPIDAPGLDLAPVRMIDDRTACDVTLAGVLVPDTGLLGVRDAVAPALEQADEDLRAGLLAQGAGIARRMYEDTVEYTRQRHQFGQPLARFQALQHRLVDMLMQVEMAQSASHLAALSLTAPPAERRAAIEAATIVTHEALRFVGENAVQLHGAMGLTDELAVSHYFRRATALIQQLGSHDHAVSTYARTLKAAA